MKTIRLAAGSAALAAALALAGCFGPPSPGPSPSASASQSVPPSASASTTTSASPAPSSSTGTPSASAPSTASTTPTPSTAPTPSTPAPSTSSPTAEPTGGQLPEQTAPLTIYYIAVGDGGVSGPAVGCGDSAVATYTEPVTFRDQVGPSLNRLFANHSRTIGQSGLINVLYQSNLTYVSGSFDGTTITVQLSGSFLLGGVCDIPRAEAQINLTAMAAAGAQRAAVFVNGRPLADVLSLKG
ncbi:hypothetical protein [Sinomonas sp. P10A9]|uniref:Sporulation and spore germination protein n=1 Tax=Sinomonas puerhi TaxID=3238584 RepID=A0AB39L234_9MICC